MERLVIEKRILTFYSLRNAASDFGRAFFERILTARQQACETSLETGSGSPGFYPLWFATINIASKLLEATFWRRPAGVKLSGHKYFSVPWRCVLRHCAIFSHFTGQCFHHTGRQRCAVIFTNFSGLNIIASFASHEHSSPQLVRPRPFTPHGLPAPALLWADLCDRSATV